MHKLVFTISRFVFAGTALLLLVIIFMVVVMGSSFQKQVKIISEKSNHGQRVILAVQNEMATVGGDEITTETAVADDARPLLIKKYLEKYHSPLIPYSDLILKLSQIYGFDYYWIVAIAQQESNLCKKIPENSYNCWGYGIHKNGTLKFDSYDLALKSYAEYLKREYFDKGLNTPELIMKKYCPHSDGSWARGVQQFIDELEEGR